MDNKLKLEEMAKQAARISSHIDRMKNKPGEVHELDIDMMSDKLKVIYSFCLDLETIDELENEISTINDLSASSEEDVPSSGANKGLPISETEAFSPKRDEIPAEEEERKEDEIKATEEPEPKPEMTEQESRDEKPVAEDGTNEQKAPGADAAEEEFKPRTTADLFSGTTTIADKFQKGEDRSIAARVAPQGVNDLKTAIGINDKFIFINELFKGDLGIYNKAIDDLNSCDGQAQALSVLNGFKEEYSWSDNSEAHHRLRKLIISKYPD